ncbi:MAG TPA: protein kinase [Gemmatimonadales bacterium]|nr:protein kinase [Gemmatimonadales bacterium]
MECARCHTPLPDKSKFCFACGMDQTGGADGLTSGQTESLLARLQRIVEGKYKIERMLGKGGMGAVFLAQDLTLERQVAIKVLPPDIAQDDQVVKRFQQEAKTAAKLDHTNIIPIFRVESEGGLNYFVMKYIAGTSLEDVLEHEKRLPTDYIQRVLWEAACALGHAHTRGIVHRDVKPANIMFDHDGRVMLTDFGISKALQGASGFTGTGMIIGTPHYMAPEQAKGQQVDGRADQYSLGVVGYRMITGALPFSGDSVHTILYKHIFEEAPRIRDTRKDLPEFLSAAVSRALSKEPEQRYATMEDFATAVWPEQPVKAQGPVTPVRPRSAPVTPETPTEHVVAAATTPLPQAQGKRRPAPKRRGAGVYVGVGAAVLILGAAAAMMLSKSGDAGATPRDTLAARGPVTDTVHTVVQVPETVRQQVVAPPTPHRQAQRPVVNEPPAAAQGFISVNADPYGEVIVDGVDHGATPLIGFALAPGKHTIKVQREGYKTVTETVQVDAGNTVAKHYTLIAEGP